MHVNGLFWTFKTTDYSEATLTDLKKRIKASQTTKMQTKELPEKSNAY